MIIFQHPGVSLSYNQENSIDFCTIVLPVDKYIDLSANYHTDDYYQQITTYFDKVFTLHLKGFNVIIDCSYIEMLSVLKDYLSKYRVISEEVLFVYPDYLYNDSYTNTKKELLEILKAVTMKDESNIKGYHDYLTATYSSNKLVSYIEDNFKRYLKVRVPTLSKTYSLSELITTALNRDLDDEFNYNFIYGISTDNSLANTYTPNCLSLVKDLEQNVYILSVDFKHLKENFLDSYKVRGNIVDNIVQRISEIKKKTTDKNLELVMINSTLMNIYKDLLKI